MLRNRGVHIYIYIYTPLFHIHIIYLCIYVYILYIYIYNIQSNTACKNNLFNKQQIHAQNFQIANIC